MVYADIDPNDTRRVIVESSYVDKERLKLIPGARWDPDLQVWTTPTSWAACLQLRGLFGDQLTVGPELTRWSWQQFNDRIKVTTDLRERFTCEVDPNERRYPFQVIGTDFMLASDDALLGDELGTGKTITALAALEKGDALPALVICPNTVKHGWKKAAVDNAWLPEANVYVLSGSMNARRKTLVEAKNDPNALVITNIESVRQLSRLAPYGNVALTKCRECDSTSGQENVTTTRCEVHRKELNGFGFKTVVLDEAHRIKEPRSKQTRACWAVGHDPSVRRRWAMTGTPVANHVGDLWSIMHFVAPYEYPTKSKFIDRYALTSWNPYGGVDIVGVNPATRDEFHRIFDPRFRRTPKALVLDQLPSVVRSTRWVQMTPKQASAYKELEKHLVTRLDDGSLIVAPNNLVKGTRLLQLSSAYAETTWTENPLTADSRCGCLARGLSVHADDCMFGYDLSVRLAEPSPKIDALEETIAERGDEPIVVAAESRQLIEMAARRLEKRGIKCGQITGAVPEYERHNVIDRFQRNRIQVVLFTMKAGGTGVDGLQHSDTLAVIQRSWSMIDNVQMEGRINRIGSEKHSSIHIIDYVAEDTVEERVLFPRLRSKFEQLDEINRDRARLAAAGVETTDMFSLEEKESQILASYLNVPNGS